MSHWRESAPATPPKDESTVHQFVEGWEHPEWGKVQFANENFVSMITKYPPGAHRCNDMWNCGWEIYVQPEPTWNGTMGDKHYITTYKRRTI